MTNWMHATYNSYLYYKTSAKAKPVAKQGRKAADLSETAGLPRASRFFYALAMAEEEAITSNKEGDDETESNDFGGHGVRAVVDGRTELGRHD